MLLCALLLVSGCAGEKKEPDPLDMKEAVPVKMVYERRWEYYASAESEDKELISAVKEKIKSFRIGTKSDIYTEDFTDVIVFVYADGSEERFVFEGYNIVLEKEEYEVEGDLGGLRTLLEKCFE